ncbi:MAG: RluA family pseudouridine synthase [Gemmatales bacterium]|nr:RluA family pseudouridine synthase [Gemmatales bacterium]MDW7993788.1 RluA family pseudouridine synthase [Gemmatales bacterium]
MAEVAAVYRVSSREVGRTLAAALRVWQPTLSWSRAKTLIESGRVLVNGAVCRNVAHRVVPGDVVKVLPHAPKITKPRPNVVIRHLDADIVVVEKPPGTNAVRHPEEERLYEPTVAELLPRLIAEYEGRPASGRLPAVRAVHRLDRDTSGLMVFARTSQAERHLGLQFRKHTIHRVYLAIARGRVEERTIVSRLVRDRGDGRRGSTPLPNVGKLAITLVRPLEYLGEYTLVECRLKTGRTHQIRIHLAEQGHPLCGETVYNKPIDGPRIPDKSGAPRLALHAAELGFRHPTLDVWMEFRSELPKDLRQFLEKLRRRANNNNTRP